MHKSYLGEIYEKWRDKKMKRLMEKWKEGWMSFCYMLDWSNEQSALCGSFNY